MSEKSPHTMSDNVPADAQSIATAASETSNRESVATSVTPSETTGKTKWSWFSRKSTQPPSVESPEAATKPADDTRKSAAPGFLSEWVSEAFNLAPGETQDNPDSSDEPKKPEEPAAVLSKTTPSAEQTEKPSEEQLADAKQKLDALNTIVEFLQTDLNDRTSELHKSRVSEGVLKDRIKELEKMVAELTAKLGVFQHESKADGSVRQPSSTTRMQLVGLQYEISRLKVELHKAQETLEAKTAELEHQKNISMELQQKLDKGESRTSNECFKQCQRNVSRIRELQAQLNRATQKIHKNEDNLKKQREMSQFVGKALREPNVDLSGVINEREQVTFELGSAYQQIEDMTGELEEARELSKEKDEEIRELRAQLDSVLDKDKVRDRPAFDGIRDEVAEASSSTSETPDFDPVDPVSSVNASSEEDVEALDDNVKPDSPSTALEEPVNVEHLEGEEQPAEGETPAEPQSDAESQVSETIHGDNLLADNETFADNDDTRSSISAGNINPAETTEVTTEDNPSVEEKALDQDASAELIDEACVDGVEDGHEDSDVATSDANQVATANDGNVSDGPTTDAL